MVAELLGEHSPVFARRTGEQVFCAMLIGDPLLLHRNHTAEVHDLG